MSPPVINQEDIYTGIGLRRILGFGDQRIDESQLPSLADADGILSRFLMKDSTNSVLVKDRQSQWRTVALKWLAYGSMVDESPLNYTAADGSTSSPNRIEQTVHFFIHSIRAFREKVHESKHSSSSTDVDSPERILVDVFWFMATQLHRETVPSSTMTTAPPAPASEMDTSSMMPSDGQSIIKNTTTLEPFASFCSIINGIFMGLENTSNDLTSSTSHDSANNNTTTTTTIIPFSLPLAGMEPVHLTYAGLLTDSTTTLASISRSPITRDFFTKQFSKYITNLYYKQTHSSLLMQEESEGYSKLLHLFMNLPWSLREYMEVNGKSILSLPSLKKMFQEKILEMIGTFSLAPIRVLDLILDMLESLVRSLPDSSMSWAHRLDHSPNKVIAIHLLIDVIQMYPCPNVAHLIGFKLWSYASSSDTLLTGSSTTSSTEGPKTGNKLPTVPSSSSLETDGVKGKALVVSTEIPNTIPQSLYITCALLVSHGIQVLQHILPRLQVDLSSIQSAYDKKRKDDIIRIRKIGIISLNSSVGSSSTKTETSEITTGEEALKKEPVVATAPSVDEVDSDISKALKMNHLFLDLVQACLHANLPWEDICSLFDPFMDEESTSVDTILEACCGIYTPIGASLCYYMDGMVSDLYTERIESKPEMAQVHRMLLNDTDEEKLFILCDDKGLISPSSLSRRNRLSVQSTLLDVARALIHPLQCVVNTGSIVHYPLLYSKILRLVNSFLSQDVATEMAFDQDTSYLFESFLVPSICLFPFNTAVSAELWSVLSAISSYPIRYSLYGSIRSSGLEKEALRKVGAVRKPLLQIESEVESGREVRYRLRRVSMENVREVGKQIAKVANTNPLVVFTAILNQIESYDNLISLMVDTFEFLTSFSLDVLGYCLLTFLGGGDAKVSRTKTKDDGISTAQWLSSLATFIGAFYRKFPDVEVRGLLSHMVKKISEGSVVELCVLQSLLKTAGGYGFADCSSIASLSQVQLEGRCGSLELRRETSDFGVIEKYNPSSSSKLRYALQSTNNFGAIFLILLCQIRYKLFNMKMSKIKLVGNALDMCQRTTFVLLTFITESLVEQSNDDDSLLAKYATSLPSPQDLLQLYGLEPVEIWTLHRPIFRLSLSASSSTNLSTSMSYETIDKMVSNHYKQTISHTLYQVFFVLSIYDITCPEERYMLETNRLNKDIDRLTTLQKGGKEAQGTISAMTQAAAAAGVTGKDLRDASLFTKSHEEDLLRMKRTVDKLSVDMARQKTHYETINTYLHKEKGELFLNVDQTADACKAIQSYISECISPRCRLSPEDAMFCSRFTSLLHKIDTPNFYLLFFYHSIIESFERIIYGLTEDEASNFAIFFQDSWNCINAYRFDANLYESSLQGKIGSFWPTDAELKLITHSDFLEIYKRWHDSVTVVVLGALNAAEYMYCRVALIILSRLHNVFPTNARTGRKLMKALLRFQAIDFGMQDLKAMAQGYKSQLLKARDDGLWKEDKAAIVQENSGEQDDKRESLDTDLEMKDVPAESKYINDSPSGRPKYHSTNGHNVTQDTDVLQTESETKHPDEVTVVHEYKSVDVLVESSMETEQSADSNERSTNQSDTFSQEGKTERPNAREPDHGSLAVNGGNENHASKEASDANTGKVDGPNLGTRWEKADESRGRKRKGTYQTANDAQRRSDGKSNGRQQYHRRSY